MCTALWHLRWGRKPVFRAGERMTEAMFIEVLKNPRVHTGTGYRQKKNRNKVWSR